MLRVAIVLLLLLGVGGLTPMAYASPPDPSWVRGIYDDADGDDVVVLITSATAMTTVILVVDLRPLPCVSGVPQHSEEPFFALPLYHLQSRAPPAA